MEISITSLLLLIVILFTGHCFGIKCYACQNNPEYVAHGDDPEPCLPDFVPYEVECKGGREDRTFCVIEEDLEQNTYDLGCYRQAEVLPRNPYCQHHSHRQILPIPPSIGMNNTRPPDIITQYKFCLCNTSLCNKYRAQSFKCLACKYPRYPFNHDCSPNETPVETRCLLDEFLCGYETYPKRKIGCVVPFPFQRKYSYNLKKKAGHYSYCLKNDERTGCYCNTTICNNDAFFVEPPLTTTTKSTGETKSFSVAITLLFMSIALSRIYPDPDVFL